MNKEEWIVGKGGVSNLSDVHWDHELICFFDKVTGNYWDSLVCCDTYTCYENACRAFIAQLERDRKNFETDLRVAQASLTRYDNRIKAVEEDILKAEAARVERMRQEIAESRRKQS